MMETARTAGAEDALELETLCGALGRDRSHVLVLAVAPRASTAELPALLAERLAGSLEFGVVPLAGMDPDAAVARVVAEHGGRADAAPDEVLLELVAELEQRGSALVLALPDAASIPAPTLARLGRLASDSGRGLRLALFVDCDADSAGTATSELVVGLGVGVEKVALGMPADEGARLLRAPGRQGRPIAPARPATAGPPRIQPEAGRRSSHVPAIRVRGPGRRPRYRAAGWIAAGLLAASSVAWWPAIGPTRTSDSGPISALAPVAAQPAIHAAPPPARQRASAATSTVELAARAVPSPETRASILAEAIATPVDPWPSEGVPSLESISDAREAVPTSTAMTASSARPRAAVAAPVQQAVAEAVPPPKVTDSQPTSPAAHPPDLHPEPQSPPPAATRSPKIPVSMNASPWAHIEVDGRSLGTTPLADIPMAEGSHRVRVRFPDDRVVEHTVEVDAFSTHFRF